MNRILQFPKRGRPLRRPEVRQGPSAQILFFTGVRYERQAGASAIIEAAALNADRAGARRVRVRRKKSA